MSYYDALLQSIAAMKAGQPMQPISQQTAMAMPAMGGDPNSQAYQQLMDAVAQARTSRADFDQQQISLDPLLQKQMEYSTIRSRGVIPQIGEAIYDSFKRKKYEPELQKALTEANASARGLDDADAEVAALQEQYRKQQEAAEKAAEEARLAGLYQGADVDPGQAALLAAGGKLPQGPSQTVAVKNALAMGLQEGSPEFTAYVREATLKPGVQVNNYPKPDKGYMFVDQNNPGAGMVPIPGGPAAQKMESAEEKETRKQAGEAVKLASLNDTVQKAISILGPTTTGIPGAVLAGVPGSDRKALAGYLDTLKSNLGFDKLAEMRANSPTGGALGNVSNIELGLLTSAWGSLDPDQPPEVLRENMLNIQTRLQNMNDIMQGKMPQGYDDSGNPVSAGQETKVVNGKTYIKQDGQWYEAGN